MTRLPISPRHRWKLWMILGALLGQAGAVFAPRLPSALGLEDFGHWFLDSYSVLAASDTVRAGGDINQPMQFDILHRAHIYSDWWFLLGSLGLTRKDNFAVGLVWVVAFLAAAFVFLRPRSGREAAWYVVLLLSPPVLMAVFRANSDLVIFTLLVSAAMNLRRNTRWGAVAALAAIALAGGLKFYPLAAAGVFLLLRPGARMRGFAWLALPVLAAVVIDIAPTMMRGFQTLPFGVNVFGAPVLAWDFDLPGRLGSLIGLVALGSGGWWLARAAARGEDWTAGPEEPAERAGFVIGAAVLVGCFLAGASYSYRCIAVLLLAPWLWRRAAAERAVRIALWLCTATMWLDGLFCLTLNTLLPGMTQEAIDRLERGWQMSTQPLVWALMTMLAGWLIQMAVAARREVACAERRVD